MKNPSKTSRAVLANVDTLSDVDLDAREAQENAAIEAEHKAMRDRAALRMADAGPMLDGDIQF